MRLELSNLGQKASEFVARTKDALRKRYNPVEGCGRIWRPRVGPTHIFQFGSYPPEINPFYITPEYGSAKCDSGKILDVDGSIMQGTPGRVKIRVSDEAMICDAPKCQLCTLPKPPLN